MKLAPTDEQTAEFEVPDRLDATEVVFEEAERRGWTDGLPIVPPTAEAVSRMLATVDGAPDDVIALLEPTRGAATLEKLAVCAVMAGCRPEYFPVVVAAIRGLAEPRFELYGINTTTNPVAPLLILNGPVRGEIGANAQYGVMGPGWRANATIGRAVSLAMINIAGRVPGGLSRATHGYPGRYTFCIAEFEEASPWEPLHVEHGHERDDSCVTVMAPTGTTNILDMTSKTAEGLLTTIAGSMTAIGSVNMFPFFGLGPMLLVLCPDHAAKLAREGYSKADVKAFLFRATERIPLDVWPTEYQASLIQYGRAKDGFTPLAKGPEQFEIVVAGGRGGYHSVFMPTFGDSWPITKTIARRRTA
jgi:hypothetical protein